MPSKTGITLRDVVAHIQGLRNEMNERFDGVERRLGRVEHRLTNVEDRLTSVEHRLFSVESSVDRLDMSHRQLQINVLGHVERIKTLERRSGVSRR